ncbi:MAG: hypothetical protein A2Y76_04865 [Planctomycetes bacterium RBG_13_60_9]|nr:MAG: hypothetical protein A2Y76_04865 [Planctomycetes bacterium RBG_13_60_9]
MIEIDRTVAETLAKDDAAFEACYTAGLGENVGLLRDVVQQTLALLETVPRDLPWGGYLGVDTAGKLVVGTCAFKTGPSDDGAVEIAYFTFPQFEGRGFATAMVRKLLAIALASPYVQTVIAHTLPQSSASMRVLEKVGMHCVGEVEDPQDGRVWRWRYDRQAH